MARRLPVGLLAAFRGWILVAVLAISACAAVPPGPPGPPDISGFLTRTPGFAPVSGRAADPRGPITLPDPAATKVLIYSHGTTRPHRREDCRLPYNAVPPLLMRIGARPDFAIYYLCSQATDEGETGSYIGKRTAEILDLLDRMRAAGVPPGNIFLVGHSAGAWSSLMAMKAQGRAFNAAIVFAPACCGPRHERSIFPVWRETIRPAQVAQMTAVARIEALVIAFPDDAFNRPRDLAFLREDHPRSVRIAVPACGDGHQSHLGPCAEDPALETLIETYLAERLEADGS
jgi:hypothetical protein